MSQAVHDRFVAAMTAVEAALGNGLDTIGERVHVMSHVSHVYPDGASLYTTYIFRLATDPAETFDRWLKLKTSASLAIAVWMFFQYLHILDGQASGSPTPRETAMWFFGGAGVILRLHKDQQKILTPYVVDLINRKDLEKTIRRLS